MKNQFLDNTTIISYSDKNYEKTNFSTISEIELTKKNGLIKWLNTYGINFKDEFKTIVNNNNLDDFLIRY